MPLDLEKPYGVVYNHPSIAFVQNGVNYGHDKKPVDEVKQEARQPQENWRK